MLQGLADGIKLDLFLLSDGTCLLSVVDSSGYVSPIRVGNGS